MSRPTDRLAHEAHEDHSKRDLDNFNLSFSEDANFKRAGYSPVGIAHRFLVSSTI